MHFKKQYSTTLIFSYYKHVIFMLKKIIKIKIKETIFKYLFYELYALNNI